jgi:hypothetical protein
MSNPYHGDPTQLPPGMESLACDGFNPVTAPEVIPMFPMEPPAPCPIFKGTYCNCEYRIDLRLVKSVTVEASRTRVYIQDADAPAYLFDGLFGEKFVSAYDAYHGVL